MQIVGTAHHHKCNCRDLICNWKICQIEMQIIFYIKIVKLRYSEEIVFYSKLANNSTQLLSLRMRFG